MVSNSNDKVGTESSSNSLALKLTVQLDRRNKHKTTRMYHICFIMLNIHNIHWFCNLKIAYKGVNTARTGGLSRFFAELSRFEAKKKEEINPENHETRT